MCEQAEMVKLVCGGECDWTQGYMEKEDWDKRISRNEEGKARCPICNRFTVVAEEQ